MAKVYAADVGTVIKLDTDIDLTIGVSEVKILAKNPLGVTSSLAPVDVVEIQKLRHTKTASTLSTAGRWLLQAYVKFTNTNECYGEIAELIVYSPLVVSK